MADKRGFRTRAIHAGQPPEPVTGAVMTPIFQVSTFAQDALGKHKGYEYARTGNPTRSALEANLASLENGRFGFCFGSGLIAITTLMHVLKAGDHVVCTDNLYGGSYRLFENILTDHGLSFSFVNSSDIATLKSAIKPETKMLFVETPTNPMLRLTDLEAVVKLGREHNCLTVCDNTFMSPYFQNPLDYGIDVVLHSTTKYINGHSDIVGGVLITSDEALGDRIGYLQNAMGGVPGPMDCFLTLRATKTLAVRMEAHQDNAMAIATFLENHPNVDRVAYPGLDSHPDHELAKRQMRGFGGIVTFELKSDEAVNRFVTSTKLFTLAESLGGVESLICHPVTMTHGAVPESERVKFGLTHRVLRLSVGIEDKVDLIHDLTDALNQT